LQNCSSEDKKKLAALEDNKHSRNSAAGTFERLHEVVENAVAEWEGKKRYFAGASAYALRFLNKMGNYKALLSVLPSQGQYASVLFGAFQILITVRVET
jgi:hypothetical protein